MGHSCRSSVDKYTLIFYYHTAAAIVIVIEIVDLTLVALLCINGPVVATK